MLPQRVSLLEINSEAYIQEFRRGERHIICIACHDSVIVSSYTGINFHEEPLSQRAAELNEAMDWANEEWFVTQFYSSHNYALSALPQLDYYYELAPDYPNRRTDYHNRTFLSRCIKEVFKCNVDTVHSPKMTFIFERRNFNTVQGIELMFHHATSNLVHADRNLTEITYFDCSLEPDQSIMNNEILFE